MDKVGLPLESIFSSRHSIVGIRHPFSAPTVAEWSCATMHIACYSTSGRTLEINKALSATEPAFCGTIFALSPARSKSLVCNPCSSLEVRRSRPCLLRSDVSSLRLLAVLALYNCNLVVTVLLLLIYMGQIINLIVLCFTVLPHMIVDTTCFPPVRDKTTDQYYSATMCVPRAITRPTYLL